MSKQSLPTINQNLCTLCGICVTSCPENALVMESTGPIFLNPTSCTYCAACEEICPTGAIRAPLTVRWSPGSSI